MFISGHKGNTNQNHRKIPPHSCQNSYHQEHHQQTINVDEEAGEKKTSYTAGGNVS
jgi:hypothetical protein